MIPLVDADVIRYEIGFAAETGWKAIKEQKGEALDGPPPFDYVAELLEGRIEEICKRVEATSAPILFLTGKGNFREKIAQKKGYKANRENMKKPWHYNNLTAYLIGVYDARVVEGMEADDAICIFQCEAAKDRGHLYYDCNSTIICTRDKDLRQCPGWHFGWELGKQPQFGPEWVDEIGYINIEKGKIKGVGAKFFYSQLITGDQVDNVPGLPGYGAKFAYELLNPLDDVETMEREVALAYEAYYGETWREEMREQAQLLYMIRELDEEGNPKMWRFLDEKE